MDLIGIEPMTSSMPLGYSCDERHTGIRGKKALRSAALKKKCPSCALVFDRSFPEKRSKKRCRGKP